MSIRADLHFHSIYSDGKETPTAMAERAAAAGIELAALTDHDSMEGVDEFLSACSRLGIQGIAATEVDSTVAGIGFDMELLAYFPRGNWQGMRGYLGGRLGERESITRQMIAAAASLFQRPDLTFEDFLHHRLGHVPDPPLKIAYIKYNIYQYLQDRGAIPKDLEYRPFRQQYLQEDKLGIHQESKPAGEDLVARVRDAGGIVVLPHPAWALKDFHRDQTAGHVDRHRDRLREVLHWCKAHGVWGVELNHYWDETAAINAIIAELAAESGFPLIPGSDDHGRGSTHATMEKHQEYNYDFIGFPE